MDGPRTTLEGRLESIGWGLLFLLVAAIALPDGTLQYAVVGLVGVAILGLNAYRAMARLEVSWFGVVLGGSCAVAGAAALGGLHADVFVVFFVLAALVTFASAIRPQPAPAR